MESCSALLTRVRACPGLMKTDTLMKDNIIVTD